MKKYSIFELEKYKTLFHQNKIFFHRSKANNKRGFTFIKSECNILYFHLLPFVIVSTRFDLRAVVAFTITLLISKKNKKLVNQIKKLILSYNKKELIHFDFSINQIDDESDYEVLIDILNEDEEYIPNHLQDYYFNNFNKELTDTIQKYYNYIPNYKPYGVDYFQCDGLIANTIEILNQKHYPTIYCCDSDDDAPFNPKINYNTKNEDSLLDNIIHCSAYIAFSFECTISDYKKIIRKFKYYYKKCLNNNRFKDVLYFEINGLSKKYQDFLRKTNQLEKETVFNFIIRSKTPNRIEFNSAIEEFSKNLPKFK